MQSPGLRNSGFKERVCTTGAHCKFSPADDVVPGNWIKNHRRNAVGLEGLPKNFPNPSLGRNSSVKVVFRWKFVESAPQATSQSPSISQWGTDSALIYRQCNHSLNAGLVCKIAPNSCACGLVFEGKKRRVTPISAPNRLCASLSEPTTFTFNSEDDSSEEETMLSALRGRRTEDAWRSYQALRRGGILPSQECCSRLVAQLSHKCTAASVSRAQKVLQDLQLQDRVSLLDRDALGLLAMAAARTGAAQYALSVTKLMLHVQLFPPVKVWSAVISRLAKHPYDAAVALELFDSICERITSENRNLVGEVDQGAAESADDLKISGQIPRDVWPDTGAFNAALNACAAVVNLEKAEKLLERMVRLEVEPDVITFNVILKIFSKAGEADLLPNVLEQMEAYGYKPNITTCNSLVSAYTSLGDIEEAKAVVQSMHAGTGAKWETSEDKEQSSEALDERKQASDRSIWVHRLFRESVSREGFSVGGYCSRLVAASCVKPDVRTFTILMNGYVKIGRMKDAVELLMTMQSEKDVRTHPNEVTYTTVIAACVDFGMLDEAKSVLLEMVTQNVPANIVTYNILLKGYSCSGKLSEAYELLKSMKALGLKADVVSYNSIIQGCIKRDDNVAALEVFKEMRSVGIAPSEVSFTTLMNAFARNGQPKMVAEVFEEMKQDPYMRVDVIAWNVLIDGYCRVGMINEAKESFAQMKEEGFLPTVATYGCLVKGFTLAGKAGEALVLWKEIMERIEVTTGENFQSFKPDGALFDSLIDCFVRAGFFQRALEVVMCMEEQGIFADKVKYKRMFIELYSNLYTSKHASARRRARSEDKRTAVDAFKFWLGLPNNYYESDWTP